jgi:transcription-repair coupling factor (superfamily II helicase)
LIDAFSHIEIFQDPQGRGRVQAARCATGIYLARGALQAPLLVVASSSRQAGEYVDELRTYLGEDQVVEFAPWETLPHEKLSPKGDTVAARIGVLEKLERYRVVVTSVRALIQPISKRAAHFVPQKLEIGTELELTALLELLAGLGYNRTDLVEKRGDFAVRGGIVDLFLPDQDHPIRVDFFGDEIEELAWFTVADQRTYAPVVGEIALYPCRELLITPEVQERAASLIPKYPQLESILEKIAAGSYADGMESLLGLLDPELTSIVELLPKNFEVVVLDEPRLASRALDLVETNKEFLEASWSSAAMGGQAPIDLGATDLTGALAGGGYLTLTEVKEKAISWRSIDPYASDEGSHESDSVFTPVTEYRGKFEELTQDLAAKLADGYLIIFSAAGKGLVERYAKLFTAADLPVRLLKNISSGLTRDAIYVLATPIEHGFAAERFKTLFITEKDVTGVRSSNKDQARMPSRRKKAIDPLELKPGDYVVHEQHGVGRYLELVQRTVAGVSREYLVIEYAASKRGQPGDRLFVPTDTLEQVTRYVGGEAPSVHRIGGADWQNAKKRARKAVKQIAGELIQLYAARMSAPGFAFSPDTPWQRELESAFRYVETVDQQSTIEEVKRDMERSYPMDRVVCGDVGYGKTEIAIRAAFKAVQDAKQVAVLVPTTLLVQQHFKTFEDRYAGFPVRLAGLSRFSTAKESKEILEGLANGSVDVVIGTHRLLSKDVVFKDLGLVIVDEEQRFGVEHKEELKKTRTNVDVLSMSATPIPRTLEMAITGIREMSNITTPPEERHPVLTYVGPYDEKQVTAAIHRELLRDGQIFFIHNRVESIDKVVIRLKELVPEARIRVAHGQMGERELEDVILGFWEREFDILVCTTIIESGIDIPNANTLIVDRSENFGLSQLHQLRGRVGRARERAYAYFLYSPDKPLTEVAHDRLKTIATNTELGSGMQVALKDLEIRGAGNLLGGEQSGHIAEVGFDLYMRMVGEAVSDYKKGYIDTEPESKECKVELPITAHLPAEYVPSDRLRLDLYRRMAECEENSALDAIVEELRDRFGELPQEAVNLVAVAKLRIYAKSKELTEVVLQGKFLKIGPVVLPDSAQIRLNRLYPGTQIKPATKTVLVAQKANGNWLGSGSVGDTSTLQSEQILAWADEVLHNL